MNELPLFNSDSIITPQQLTLLPKTTIAQDILGAPVPWPVSFALAIDPEWLSFAVTVAKKAVYDPAARKGSYVEGLWTQDVGEFFLIDDNGNGYQEFNLSPSGAYWSMRFSSYRNRDTGALKALEADTGSELSDVASWSAWLRVRRSSLSVEFAGASRSRANVCFHLEGRFLTFARLVSPQPDFHLIDQYPAVQHRSIAL